MTEAAADPAGTPARERVAWVLGIGLGLALLLAAGALLLLLKPREVEARAALEGSFELGPLPGELRLERAWKLASGETVVLLSDGRELGTDSLPELAAEPAEPEAADGSADGEPAEGDAQEEPKVDWSSVPEGPAGTPPARVYLVRYPESAIEQALARQFRGVEWKELSELGQEGGRVAVEGGKLDWGPYAADFVRERRYAPGPTFHDALRVNVARPDRYWIAYAFWPERDPGSKGAVEELLGALLPGPEAEPAPAQ